MTPLDPIDRQLVEALQKDGRASYADLADLAALLQAAGLPHDPRGFQRVASARSLYHWNVDAQQEY